MHTNIQLSRLILAGASAAAAATLLSGVAASATSNSWTTVASMPGGARDGGATATGPDGRIYVIGGFDGSNHLNRVEAYDVGTNTWSTEASLPGAGRGNLPVATGPDGRIYAIGGLTDTGPVSEVDAYDTTTNTWTTVASMPGGARQDLAAATGPDGRIYAIGGFDGTNILSRVEAYDTTTNTWTTEAPMPGGPREDLVAATGADGRIYAIGGDAGSCSSITSRVEAYDTKSNTWATLASMPGGGRTNLAGATGPDGRIYAIGGISVNCAAYLSRVEGFNPSSDTWTTGQAMPTARQFEGVATGPDGRIYAVGGYNGVRLTTVEAYTVIGGTLTARGATVNATEGAAFSGVAVATFSDADQNTAPSTYAATINWGDASTSAGTVTGNRASGFTVTGGHTYAEEGSFTVTVQISDLDGNSVTATGSASTGDAALTASGRQLRQSHDSIAGVVANFNDADPGGLVSDYTATISWGDGTSSAGTVAAAGGGFIVSGTHTYVRDRERATIKVTIRDAGGSEAIAVTIARE
jgi:N-acetylneuraminic acid mutarotase